MVNIHDGKQTMFTHYRINFGDASDCTQLYFIFIFGGMKNWNILMKCDHIILQKSENKKEKEHAADFRRCELNTRKGG